MLRYTALIALLQLVLVLTSSNASSTRPTPLHPRGLSHPEQLSIQLIPRSSNQPLAKLSPRSSSSSGFEPDWADSFLLRFTAHNTPFVLSLRPALGVFHKDGIKLVQTHTAEDGTRTTTSRVWGRHESRVYEGWSMRSDGVDLEKWINEEAAGIKRENWGKEVERIGWARIVLMPQEEGEGDDGELAFQGSWSVGDEVFTAHSTSNYLRTRESLDPDPPLLRKRSFSGGTYHAHPSTVVVQESQTLSPAEQIETLQKRGLPLPPISSIVSPSPSFCDHDKLSFNTNPTHPVWMMADDVNFYSPAHYSFGLFSRSPAPATFSMRDNTMFYPAQPLSYPPIIGKRSDISVSGGGANGSSNFQNVIGSTTGCPKTAKVVFVGVAADCTYTSAYGSEALARTQILTDFNSASALYSQSFNVSLGIIELNVQTGTCPTSAAQVDPANPWNVGCFEGGPPGLDLSDRLSTFSTWRGTRSNDGAGLWHLLTNCSTGQEVGVAWLGTLCQTTTSKGSGQAASGTGVTSITRTEWQVIAHEIGHNFGAIHDCSSASCTSCCPLSTTSCNANANFIMSPVSVNNVTNFSPCSIGNVCSSLAGSLNTTCLATPGASGNPALISIKQCGNGIVEPGEDCDPGGASDRCCNSATCKFATGAVCDPANNLCCTSSCQIASAGVVCRAALDPVCDSVEVCSGTNATCPSDTFAPDGTSCNSTQGLTCASGVCTSRDEQCRVSGVSLGITRACSATTSTSCAIACADPSSSNDCLILQQSFRDGTSCGYSGTCRNGACNTSGNILDVAKSWYVSHLSISIPVTVIVGIVIILIISFLIRCCFRRKSPPSSKYVPEYSPNNYTTQQLPPRPQFVSQLNQGGYPPNYNYSTAPRPGYYPPPPRQPIYYSQPAR